MNLSTFFQHLTGFFHSDKARHAFEEVSKIIPIAVPIVKDIAAMTQNRTAEEIAAAFEHYAVPFAQDAHVDAGAALLHLATTVVSDKVPAGAAKSIIQAAIQLSVVGTRAEGAA